LGHGDGFRSLINAATTWRRSPSAGFPAEDPDISGIDSEVLAMAIAMFGLRAPPFHGAAELDGDASAGMGRARD
jgi:hypothetical protein